GVPEPTNACRLVSPRRPRGQARLASEEIRLLRQSRREEHFGIGVTLEHWREHLSQVLGGYQLDGPPLAAVDHSRLHGAHVASQVDRERPRDLLLTALDELSGVRLPL